MKKRKYLVHFSDGMACEVWAWGLDGACMEASELEGKFEEMSKYVEDDKGDKYTFEIKIVKERIR